MFETRLHRFDENYALDKRKLWEGWLQWANRMSYLDSDNIARAQFGRQKFTIDAFIEMFSAGSDESDPNGIVSGSSGSMISASKKIVSLDAFGDYWVNWSITLRAKSGDCRYVGGVPVIGDQVVGSAQDFKAEMGWYNNSSITESFRRDISAGYPVGEDGAINEFMHDNWDSLGRHGESYDTRWQTKPKTVIASQVSGKEKQRVHLSGSGAATVARVTGNIGIVVFCEAGSEFAIESSRMTLHRRNR